MLDLVSVPCRPANGFIIDSGIYLAVVAVDARDGVDIFTGQRHRAPAIVDQRFIVIAFAVASLALLIVWN